MIQGIEQAVKLGKSTNSDRPCAGVCSQKVGLDQLSSLEQFEVLSSFLFFFFKDIAINMESNIASIIIIIYEGKRCTSINHTNECQLMVIC